MPCSRRARTPPDDTASGRMPRDENAPYAQSSSPIADRARIIASLAALHFAPDIDVSHVFAFAATMAHSHAHPDIYEYIRIAPPLDYA